MARPEFHISPDARGPSARLWRLYQMEGRDLSKTFRELSAQGYTGARSESTLRQWFEGRKGKGRNINAPSQIAHRRELDRFIQEHHLNTQRNLIMPSAQEVSRSGGAGVHESTADAVVHHAFYIGHIGPNGGPIPKGAKPLRQDDIRRLIARASAEWANGNDRVELGVAFYGEYIPISAGGSQGVGGGPVYLRPFSFLATPEARAPQPGSDAEAMLNAPVHIWTLSRIVTLMDIRGPGDPKAYAEAHEGMSVREAQLLGAFHRAQAAYQQRIAGIAGMLPGPGFTDKDKRRIRKEAREDFGADFARDIQEYAWVRVYGMKMWQSGRPQ